MSAAPDTMIHCSSPTAVDVHQAAESRNPASP
jgi:hypothetical protein